jgi:hypothetical protein
MPSPYIVACDINQITCCIHAFLVFFLQLTIGDNIQYSETFLTCVVAVGCTEQRLDDVFVDVRSYSFFGHGFVQKECVSDHTL